MKHSSLFFITVTSIALATCSGTLPTEQVKPVQVGNDSIKVPASSKYHKPGILRQIFIGGNYRDEWGLPVTMPVFRLKELGFTVKELGGGQQTKSLRLNDPQGKEWVLRTVDKDVEKALPEKLRNTLAEKVVQDLISAAYPYAPLVVARLSEAVQVSAPKPRLFYVPDDPAFGPHQKIFAHQICYLEERDPTLDGSESINSEDMQQKMVASNNIVVMQEQVLRARLIDMLIADWDRHADQWRWGILDSAKTKFLYAIPRDRDQAFFYASGLVPRIGKAVAMGHLNWFKKDMRGLNKLNFKSREFDRIYLNDLDEAEWTRIVSSFISQLPDAVIEDAVNRMPQAVVAYSGQEIAQRLKSRRDDMLKPVMRYYRMLSHGVQAWGSAEREHFMIREDGGKLRVQVFALNEKGVQGLLRYDRSFDPKITREIHLDGMGGADRFEVVSLPEKFPRINLYSYSTQSVFQLPKEGSKKIKVHTASFPPKEQAVKKK